MKHINYTLCNNRRDILLDMFARWWLMYLSCFSCSRSVLIPFVFKCEMYFLSFLRQNDKQGKWATVRIPWVTQKWVIIWRKNSTTSILFFFLPCFHISYQKRDPSHLVRVSRKSQVIFPWAGQSSQFKSQVVSSRVPCLGKSSPKSSYCFAPVDTAESSLYEDKRKCIITCV